MLHKPYYDPEKSYEENFKKGPYGTFADKKIYKDKGEPKYKFLGQKVYLPFGIPAGPVLNSKFVKGALEKGFDLVVYKTVRSDVFPCHPFPNVLKVNLKGNLTLKRAQKPITTSMKYREPLSITNSFGVPSKSPKDWKNDVKKAISYAKKGQVTILSFMGTVKKNQTEKKFVDDFAKSAKLALSTGAKILEVNLSCPNIGNEGLVCYNLSVTEKVLRAIRKIIRKTPLIVKTGYFEKDEELKKFAEIVNKYAQAVSAINTIAAPVVDKNGNQALPGSPMRLKSGVCGTVIRWAGLDMVKRLANLRKKMKYNYKIVGVGGVMQASDYKKYIKVGADAVMSATGSMWNPYLAQEIKKSL
jgi:dihydroorotate dehydrogenase